MAGRIHVGTSGWHYKHWLGTFYPAGTRPAEQFGCYLRDFATVEINNSFYRLPSVETFQAWRAAAPKDFIYAVKASRYITHIRKLKEPAEGLEKFFAHADELKEKLGPILFQLPPGWRVNAERLTEFLQALPRRHRYVFEFRNETWYTEDIYRLLERHGCAFCAYELAGHRSPLRITAPFVYVRLHGPGRKYQGSYTEAALNGWAERCRDWAGEGRDVYIYFDNDEAGYAGFNARRLRELVGQ